MKPKIAVVGSKTYFENHFPDVNPDRYNLEIFYTDERFFDWLRLVSNFDPDLTIFYRPEMLPEKNIEEIPGRKIAFLSEPVSRNLGAKVMSSMETLMRETVYRKFKPSLYDWTIFYDKGQAGGTERYGLEIDEYRPLPINEKYFNINTDFAEKRDIDFLFVGKPTQYRMKLLEGLQNSPLNFVWLAHGISGEQLGKYLRRSRIVLNLHSDGLPAFEPRVYLAASCGAYVLTEELSHAPEAFHQFILENENWNPQDLKNHLIRLDGLSLQHDFLSHQSMSTQKFLDDMIKKFDLNSPKTS
jgi:hypothetical protein